MKKQTSDWREGITVPMPKIWVPDEDYIGQKVGIRMCEFHEDCDPAPGCARKDVSMTGNCNCELKGKTVTITGLKATPRSTFYRSTCYTIAESPNLIFEIEFATEQDIPGQVSGYVLEGEDGNFLTAAYTYSSKVKQPLYGYIFNTGLIKILLKSGVEGGNPIKAWPVKCDQHGNERTITGDPISWEELSSVILVKKK